MSATSSNALASELRSLAGKPRWDGLPGSSAFKFIEDTEDYFVSKGIGAVLFKDKFNLPALAEETAQIANATVFSTLRKSVPPAVYQTIKAESAAASDAADGEEATAAAIIGVDAVKLWAAIIAKTNGIISSTSGFDLQRDIRSWVFPNDPSLNNVERVSIAVSQQQDFCDRAAALQNPQFPHTQAQACHAIVQLLPSMLAINKRQYRSYMSLAALGNELAIDAADFDTDPQMIAMAAAMSKTHFSTPPRS
jgi:hypothetical protein